MKNEEIKVTLYNTDTHYEDIVRLNPDGLKGYIEGIAEQSKSGFWNNTTITIEIGNIEGTE